MNSLNKFYKLTLLKRCLSYFILSFLSYLYITLQHFLEIIFTFIKREISIQYLIHKVFKFTKQEILYKLNRFVIIACLISILFITYITLLKKIPNPFFFSEPLNCLLSISLLFPLNVKTLTFINKPIIISIHKRFMLSAYNTFVGRAIYHVATTLSNSDIVNKVNKKNTQPFVKEVVDLSLNHEKGVLQHKASLFKHLTHQKFPSEEFYDNYKTLCITNKVRCEPYTEVDFRTLNELGTLQQYQNQFDNSLEWIIATMDSRPSNFPNQKQSNVDFWVMLKTKFDRSMGLGYKCVYQDDKSGMDIIAHSSRGSIGLLSYDNNGNNIPITTKPITVEDVIRYNEDRSRQLTKMLTSNGVIDPSFKEGLEEIKAISAEMSGKSFNDMVIMHNKIQELLWREFQCNPSYDRSVSFIFLKEIVDTPLSLKEEAFSKVFRSHIQNKIYDLNNRQDFIDIYKAMIFAGKSIDPHFIDKLHHLHNNGIMLNKHLLPIIADLIKYGL